MLRPAVQPGAKLDYEWPAEVVTLVLRARPELGVTATSATASGTTDKDGCRVARLTYKLSSDTTVPLEVTLVTGSTVLELAVAFHTNEDARERALPVRRFLLPWAILKKDAGETHVVARATA